MTKLNIEIFADNEIVFCKGQNLVNRNRVSVKKSPDDENGYDAKVYDADACYLVNFKLLDEQVEAFSCSCNAKKPCHHLIAGLIKHSDQEYKINKMHMSATGNQKVAPNNTVKKEE